MSSYAYDGYKAYCQRKFLTTSTTAAPRSCPPCLLEWQSAQTFETMALPFSYPLGDNTYCVDSILPVVIVGDNGHFRVDSWMTASEAAKVLAQNK